MRQDRHLERQLDQGAACRICWRGCATRRRTCSCCRRRRSPTRPSRRSRSAISATTSRRSGRRPTTASRCCRNGRSTSWRGLFRAARGRAGALPRSLHRRPARWSRSTRRTAIPTGSDKFAYKLDWLDRLYDHTRELLASEDAFVLGGDFNVAPDDDDVYDPVRLEGRRAVPAGIPRRSPQASCISG